VALRATEPDEGAPLPRGAKASALPPGFCPAWSVIASGIFEGGNRSPGVLIVPQGAPVGRVIESILLVWIASEAAEWVDRIVWLPI
jgi:hypothetical protein